MFFLTCNITICHCLAQSRQWRGARNIAPRCGTACHVAVLPRVAHMSFALMPSFAHVNHVVIMVLGEDEKRVGMVCGSKQTKPQIIPTRSVTIVVVGCKKVYFPVGWSVFQRIPSLGL